MGWASKYIEVLERGETVSLRPQGRSMEPLIKSGDLVTLDPVKNLLDLREGDVVLCKIGGKEYLHLLKELRAITYVKRYLIGNNKGHSNGWISGRQIYGRLRRG